MNSECGGIGGGGATSEPPLADDELDHRDGDQHHDDEHGGIGDGEAEFAGLDAADDIGGRHVVLGRDEEDHGAHRRHGAHEGIDQ